MSTVTVFQVFLTMTRKKKCISHSDPAYTKVHAHTQTLRHAQLKQKFSQTLPTLTTCEVFIFCWSYQNPLI